MSLPDPQVKLVKHPTEQFTVPKLKEGRSYMFRVIAESIHGDSEALETDMPTKAESPFCEQTAPNSLTVYGWCL